MKSNDTLYEILEQHLFSEEDKPALEPFAQQVVDKYLSTLEDQGYYIQPSIKETIEEDLLEEVIEMTRKKTYGYLNVNEFRKNSPKRKI